MTCRNCQTDTLGGDCDYCRPFKDQVKERDRKIEGLEDQIRRLENKLGESRNALVAAAVETHRKLSELSSEHDRGTADLRKELGVLRSSERGATRKKEECMAWVRHVEPALRGLAISPALQQLLSRVPKEE